MQAILLAVGDGRCVLDLADDLLDGEVIQRIQTGDVISATNEIAEQNSIIV